MAFERSIVVDVQSLTRRFQSIGRCEQCQLPSDEGIDFWTAGPERQRQIDDHSHVVRGARADLRERRPCSGTTCGREAEQIKRRIGYMSQKFSLYSRLDRRREPGFLRPHLWSESATTCASAAMPCSN